MKKIDVEIRNFGGVRGVFFKQKESYIETDFEIREKIKAGIWGYVYFPWQGEDTISIDINGNKFIGTARSDSSGRWNIGNFQIWHWVKFGEIILEKGKYKIVIKGDPLVRIDKLVLYWGEDIRKEEYFIGSLSTIFYQTPKFILKDKETFIIEAEEFEKIDATIKKEGNNLVVELENDGDIIAGIVLTPEAQSFQIWAKIYFKGKNMFEGYTMEEMANQLYFSIDGELKKTIFNENGDMWYWAYLGEYNFDKGKHLIILKKVGVPVKIDKLSFYKGKDVFLTEWFNEQEPHTLPFDIPNNISFIKAKRVSDYRIFGDLSSESKVTWLGKEKEGVMFPLEIQLPKKSGYLILEKVKGVRSSEANSYRNRETQISLFISGNAPDTKIGLIYFDRTGEAFLSYLTPKVDWKGFRLVSHNIPLFTFENKGTFFDKTGERPEEFLSPEISEQSLTEIVFSEGGNKDGIPDYPLEIKYIIFEKKGNEQSKIIIGEPFFEDNLEIRGRVYKEEETIEGQKITIEMIIYNKSIFDKNVLIYYAWRVYPYSFLDNESNIRTLESKIVFVPKESSVSYFYTKTLKKQGLYKFFYTIGQKEPKYLFYAIGKEAQEEMNKVKRDLEKKFGGFSFKGPIKNKDGSIIKREEVSSLYGKNFILLSDGIDVCSVEYAEKINLEEKLVPCGYDLSDENGWPEIEIPPGVVAIDPILGRVKFFSGNKEKLAELSRLDTGFGIPSSIKIKDNFVFIPPGEGEFTVVSVLDKKNPEIASFIPSWYFVNDILFFQNYAYFETSKRGLILVDDISNPYRPGSLRLVNFDRAKHGRMTAIYEDKKIAISEGKDGLYIHSLENILNPKLIGEIKEVNGFFLSPDKKYAFSYLGEKIVLFNMENPEKPFLLGSFLEGKYRIVAISNDKIAVKDGNEVSIYQYKDKNKKDIEFKKVGSLKIPLNCGRHLLFTFNKDYFYLIDGKSGPGQYSVSYGTPSSRWFIYEIKENSEPIFIYEEKVPTVYSSICIDGDYGYIVDYNYGLWIFDLSDPTKPKKISGIATAGEADACWISDKYLYMWQTFGGAVFIIDISNPEKPKRIGEYWDGAWVSYEGQFRGNYTIGGKDNFFYIPKQKKGIIIVDASVPKQPKRIGELLDETGNIVMGSGSCIYTKENIAFVIDKKNKLIIYDISSPDKPKVLSFLSMPEKINTLYAKGYFLYLGGDKVLYLVDIKNKQEPKIFSKFDLSSLMNKNECIGGIAVANNYAYLTIRGGRAPSRKLCIINLSFPEKPKLVKIFTPLFDLMSAPCSSCWADFYQELIVSGNYLFIGNYGQIECYDISDPENPSFFDRKHIGYQWSIGKKKGKYLYVPTLKGLVVLSVPNSSQSPENLELKILP
ncbi:MAG: hypothetical protein NC921_00845 [Candidatus Omnitrophica bacterium]|nr:hypothetical protein [Candidatus Omnitrophota bacterium]